MNMHQCFSGSTSVTGEILGKWIFARQGTDKAASV